MQLYGTLIVTQACPQKKYKSFPHTLCVAALFPEIPFWAWSHRILWRRFWHWLEEDYHRKPHSSLGKATPLDLWLSQADKVRTLDDPEILTTLFRKREKRKVRHDATISVQGVMYEVAPRFIGKKIEVRFDDEGVFVYEEGMEVEKAKPVKFSDNAHAKRQRQMSVKDIEEKDEDKEEVAGYIKHHMELAGARHTIFTDAVEALAACTMG